MQGPLSESLLLPHGLTRVLWRRSARARRVSLRIDPSEGGVVVTLPPKVPMAAGHELLRDHAGWVAERLARLPAAVPLQHGANVPFEGQVLQIRHVVGGGSTRLAGRDLLVSGSIEFLPRRVLDFLRQTARTRLSALAIAKAAAHGAGVRRVVVKDTRTRWGSCTAAGTLMFSWRLVMAPPEVQDYVVAHEVAHLRHMNHSAQFWGRVAELTPHRTMATRWLDRHGGGLMRIG